MSDETVWEIGDRVVNRYSGIKATINEKLGHSVRVLTDSGTTFYWSVIFLLPEPPLEALARALKENP